jgi:hypothetical protein
MKLYDAYCTIERLWLKAEEVLNGDLTEGPDGLPITVDDAFNWIEDALSSIEDERDTKALNIAVLIKNARAEAEALKAEKLRLARRQQTAERKVEWLTRYLQTCLPEGTKLKDSRAVIGWRRSEGVKLTISVDELPEEYIRIKREPNLWQIKEDLKAGNAVEGAFIEERMSVQIR